MQSLDNVTQLLFLSGQKVQVARNFKLSMSIVASLSKSLSNL